MTTPQDVTRLRQRLQDITDPNTIMRITAAEIMEHHHRSSAWAVAKLLLDAAEVEVGELVAALRSGDRWTQLTDDQVDRAADLLERLAGWKESALAVEREWDAHGIATMLGCQLGESQRACIQREVPRLLDKLRELEQRHLTPAETEA